MPRDQELERTERILNQQADDMPVVIDEDGAIHPASDGNRGLAIRDDKGDYGEPVRDHG